MDHDPSMDWGEHEHAEDGFADDQDHDSDALDGGHDTADTGDDTSHQSDDPTGTGSADESGYDAHHDDGESGLSYSDEYEQDSGTDHADQGHFDDTDTSGHEEGPIEPVSGAHPDLDNIGDDPHWAEDDPFPPQLDIGEPPEPVDGFPWSDPAVLGEAHDTGAATVDGSPPADDLLAYDAHEVPEGADSWQVLAGSDDPATSSLARFWGPGT